MIRRLRACLAGLARRRDGSTAVEFALVGPLFLLCAFALFQAGFGIYSQASLARLAEHGARYLLFAPEDEQGARQAIADAMAGTPLDPAQLTISMTRLAAPYPHIALSLDYLFQAPGPIPLPQQYPLNSMVMVPLARD